MNLGLIFTGLLSTQNLKIAVLFETFSSCAKTFGQPEMTSGGCQANIKIVLLFKSTLQQAAPV